MPNNTNTKSDPKVSKLVKENPSNAALISKLNQENNSTDINQTKNYLEASLPNISNDIKSKLINNENIMTLFPDIELVIQIITSSVLAPNDMVTTSIVYNAPEIGLPIAIKDSLKEVIATHIQTNYKLETNLTKILRESLFTKGAYVEAIIPEAAVDEIINGIPDDTSGKISIESFNKKFTNEYIKKASLDIFKDSDDTINISAESYGATVNDLFEKKSFKTLELDFEITDNIGHLVAPELTKDLIPVNVKSKLNKFNKRKTVSSEAKQKDIVEVDKLFKILQNNSDDSTVFVNANKGTFRKSIGKPMILNLPVESVVPVHVVGNPDKHLGYFIVLDDKGSPVKMEEMAIDHNEYTNFKTQESKVNLITKASNNLTTMTKKDTKIENLEEVYSVILEKAIKDKLKDSVYADLAEIRDGGDVYRVMFSRALKSKKTRLVYLPKELVSYYSFDNRDNGTGKSLLEKTQMLFSIRSIVLFAKLMGYIKNSINVTKVTAILDDDDIDPSGSMEKIISESLKTRQTLLPIGLNKIDELMDWGNKVGFRYSFKHPSLPNMELDISEENRSISTPDEALEEEVKKILYMSYGLTPEIVESGYSSDFATTFKAKNLLFAKRVSTIQEDFLPQVTNHIRIILDNDESLQQKLAKILKNNFKETKKSLKKQLNSKSDNEEENTISAILDKEEEVIEYIIDKFISETYITIPSTEMVEASAMKTAFDSYRQMIDDYIDYIIVNEGFPEELVGSLGGNLDLVKAAIKNTLIRKWMTENNYVPEFSDFITKDDEGKPIFNILEEHNSFVENLSQTVSDFIIKGKEIKKQFSIKWEAATSEEVSSTEDETTTETTTGSGNYTETETSSDNLGTTTGDDTEFGDFEDLGESAGTSETETTTVDNKTDDVEDVEEIKPEDKPKETDILEPDDEELGNKVIFEEDEEDIEEIKPGKIIEEKVPDEENDNTKKPVETDIESKDKKDEEDKTTEDLEKEKKDKEEDKEEEKNK